MLQDTLTTLHTLGQYLVLLLSAQRLPLHALQLHAGAAQVLLQGGELLCEGGLL